MIEPPTMEPTNDTVLLRRFAEAGDEMAFRALADRYVGLVYGTARRHCASHHLAEEATQNVFTILARKAKALSSHPTLGGWLFRTAFYEATKATRAESTRRSKHQQWGELAEITSGGRSTDIPPETTAALDEALASLSEKERDLIVMRYFGDASFGKIGVQLGISENAGQKRTVRVLEKLAGILERRGVSMSGATATAVLMAGLGESASAAPAGLAASVSQQAVSAAGAGLAGALQPVLWGHVKIAAIVAASAAIVPIGYHWATTTAQAANSPSPANSQARKLTALDVRPTYNLDTDPLFAGTENPAERMRRILEIEDWGQRLAEIRFLVRELPIGHLPVALAVLAEREPEDWEHLRAFVEVWASRDAQAAIAFIESRPSPVREQYYWTSLIRGWVRTAPEEAWRFVSTRPPGAKGEMRINTWVSELSKTDATKAIALLAQSPEHIRGAHIQAIFYNWPADRLDSALDAIVRLDQSKWSRRAIGAIFESPANCEGLALLEKVSDRFGAEILTSPDERGEPWGNLETRFYRGWFKNDPAAAIAQLRAITDPETRDRALQGVFYQNAPGQFENRFDLMDDFGQGGMGNLRNKVMQDWLMADPQAAVEFVAAQPPDKQGFYSKAMGYHFSQRDPHGAIEWSQAIGDPAARDEFLNRFVGNLLAHDFDLSLDVMEQVLRPEMIEAKTTEIAAAYARRDPAAAMDWALENSPAGERSKAAGTVMRRWAGADYPAAMKWLGQQAPGELRDASARGMAMALNDSGEREGAMAAALEIEVAHDRWASMREVGSSWVSQDARAFRDWLADQDGEVRAAMNSSGEAWQWLIGEEE
ncbi:MAG: RNA polymerase sigma factor [Verrucomicrobiales bacterium]